MTEQETELDGMSEEEFEQLSAPDVPNILAGVQDKLHQRSGGRFYRDRFSRMAGVGLVTWLAVAAVVIIAAAGYLLLS